MIVSINQPSYLPWLGYFDRIAASDLHIVLDNVQFEKNGFTNRNKIRTKTGWCWLSVPVDTSGKFGALSIDDLLIAADARWSRKHRLAIQQNYLHAPHFSEHAQFFEETYALEWRRLIDVIDRINAYLLNAFDIETKLMRASTLGISEKKSDLVLGICRHVGATTYLSGALGRDYLDLDAFERAGIDVLFQDYRHPTYRQVYDGFEPNMAALDLLFMYGSESGKMLRTTGIPRLAVPS